jgi:hypothetical protein
MPNWKQVTPINNDEPTWINLDNVCWLQQYDAIPDDISSAAFWLVVPATSQPRRIRVSISEDLRYREPPVEVVIDHEEPQAYTEINFIHIGPLSVKELPDQLVAGLANWKQLQRVGPARGVFVNLANISKMERVPGHPIPRGGGPGAPGPPATFITFAERPIGALGQIEIAFQLDVKETPAQIVAP